MQLGNVRWAGNGKTSETGCVREIKEIEGYIHGAWSRKDRDGTNRYVGGVKIEARDTGKGMKKRREACGARSRSEPIQ